MSDQPRDLDIVVYGASGFVGALVAQYLAEHAPTDTRVALAGRSEAKIAQVIEVAAKEPEATSPTLG